MARRNGGSDRDTAWRYPASGFALASIIAVAPGLPTGYEQWPLRGPFGAFTWASCFVAAGLAFTLLFVAIGLTARHGRGARRALLGRVLPAALAFGLLALASFTAAARAVRIEQSPLSALGLALVGLALLRMVSARIAPRGRGPDVSE